MHEMRLRDYISKELWAILYLAAMIPYLFKLNALNKALLSCTFGNPFALLQYKNYTPLKFFGIAVLLFLLGGILAYHVGYRIRREIESFGEIVTAFVALLMIIVLLALLIVFIDNPILRAVFMAGLVILGVAFATN